MPAVDGPSWVSEDAVESLLDPGALLERLETAFRAYAAGRLIEMRPARIDDRGRACNFVSFHAYWPERGLATTKVLVGAERNPARGLPMIDAVIVAADADAGRIVATLAARHVTAMRTAATTFLAFRAMGLAPGATVGLIGTGVQMRAHAVMARTVGCGRLLVASANGDGTRARLAAERLSIATGLPALPLSAEAVATEADAIVLSSIAATPPVAADRFRADALVASVGSFLPGAAELAPDLVRDADIVIADWRDRLREQWRDDRQHLGPVYEGMLDLPVVLASDGRARPRGGRGVFLSDGRSLEDLAAVSLVLDKSRA